jgi:hypothetical protein
MSTDTVHPIRGSTASSAVPGPRAGEGPPGQPPPADHVPSHPVGNALRAVGVFLDTAFRVVVLGTDGTRQPDPQPEPDRGGRESRRSRRERA